MSSSHSQTLKEKTRAFILVPCIKQDLRHADVNFSQPHATLFRTIDQRLEEAIGLAKSIDLDIIAHDKAIIARAHSSTFIGKGKVEEIGNCLQAEEISVVVFDGQLSPNQQRNLEKIWKNVKVIDRTWLILEIFAKRARTNEARLQVSLARLLYQKSHLVRSWTHLERQRGGGGFTGGAGETQIELDRRRIDNDITKVKRQLLTVARTRHLHRQTRKAVPYSTVSLIGYTNAGKSTLFNSLTGADLLAKDMLFATLDPTMRLIKLPSGRCVILSDTVGFISNLPTSLVAAFHATLEEVIEADIVLHVEDISHPERAIQRQDVEKVLRSLELESEVKNECDKKGTVIHVYNKCDKLSLDEREEVCANLLTNTDSQVVFISAISQFGLENLTKLIDEILSKESALYAIDLLPKEGELMSYLHEYGYVKEKVADNVTGAISLVVLFDTLQYKKLCAQYPNIVDRIAIISSDNNSTH